MSFLSVDLKYPRALATFLFAQRVTGLLPSTSLGLDEEAAEAFRARLKRSEGYLEFGSGGSTGEAARLRVRTLSAEADRFFAEAMRQSLPHDAPVEIMDIYIGFTRDWSRPVFTSPTASRLKRWRRYSSAPFRRLDELGWFPDFILIDGRFRRACALQAAREALTHAHRVALMVDDYFDCGREHYHVVEQWLGHPERVGRAAIFEVSPTSAIEPSELDIEAAARDPE
jgi:hypothetical protein